VAVATVILISQIQTAKAQALDYEMFLTYVDSNGYTIYAKLGNQLPQTFAIVVFVNQPVDLTIRLRVGGETEYEKQGLKVAFRWSYDHTTPKSNAAVDVKITLKAKEITQDVTWAGVIVKKPVVIPKDVSEWFSPSQVTDIIKSITLTEIIKISAFAFVGLGMAFFCKHQLMLLNPLNGMNLTLMIASLFACYFAGADWSYVPYWLVIVMMTNLAYPIIKGPKVRQVLEIQLSERNMNMAGLPVYRAPDGEDAIALQTTVHALRRLLLGEHVKLSVEGNWSTNWTWNGFFQLFIANAAFLAEIGKTVEEQEAESGVFGVFRRLFRGKGPIWNTVFAINLGNAHQFDNLTYITRADAFRLLNKAYEQLKADFEKNDALRKMDVQREVEKRLRIMDHVFERPQIGSGTSHALTGAGEPLTEREKE